MSRAQRQLKALEKSERRRQRRLQARVVGGVAALALGFVALPVLVVAGLLTFTPLVSPDRRWQKAGTRFGVVALAAGLATTPSYWSSYQDIIAGQGVVTSWLGIVSYGLTVGLLPGMIGARLFQRWRESSPLTGQQAVEKRQQAEDDRSRRMAQRIQSEAHSGSGQASGRVTALRQRVAQAGAVPLGDRQGPYLGVYLRGDLDQQWRGRRNTLRFPWAMGEHVHLEGATRRGKSETKDVLVEWFLEHHPDGQVISLNAKEPAPGGEPARRLAASAQQLGRGYNVLIPGYRPYDIMRGTEGEVRQKLMDVELFSEPHHEAGTNLVLALGMQKLAAEGRSAQELEDVLREIADRQRVAQWAATNDFAAQLVEMVDPQSWRGAVQRYASDAIDLHGMVGRSGVGGWSFSDAPVSAVDLPSSTQPKASRMLLRLVLQDVNAYLTHDSRPRRADGSFTPLLVVLDELSALDDDPVIGRRVVNMMERAAGANTRFVPITQDRLGLGDERTQHAVLTNSTTISFTQISQAEPIAQLAGTRTVASASGTYAGRFRAAQDANSGSLRYEESFAVNPNELRQLGRGEAFIFSGGKYARVATTKTALGYGIPSQPSAQFDRLLEQQGGGARRDDGPDPSGVVGEEV